MREVQTRGTAMIYCVSLRPLVKYERMRKQVIFTVYIALAVKINSAVNNQDQAWFASGSLMHQRLCKRYSFRGEPTSLNLAELIFMIIAFAFCLRKVMER